MKIIKRSRAKSWLQLILSVLIFKHILALAAVNLNHIEPNEFNNFSRKQNRGVQFLNWEEGIPMHEPPMKRLLKKYPRNLQKIRIPLNKNSTVRIDCGGSHYACSDDKTCCPLDNKCCASQSSGGLMTCCPAGLDVSYPCRKCQFKLNHKKFKQYLHCK